MRRRWTKRHRARNFRESRLPSSDDNHSKGLVPARQYLRMSLLVNIATIGGNKRIWSEHVRDDPGGIRTPKDRRGTEVILMLGFQNTLEGGNSRGWLF